ncbi:MAG TPA: hypothetical protein VMW17_04620 [Candidatus Binatia bacterium]|nr:hypothetical protein [Candidatus Binatia bacterium]
MMQIAPLMLNPIPAALTLTPGLAPLLIALALFVLGLAEIVRAKVSEGRRRRTTLTTPRVRLRPVGTATKQPLPA